LALTITIEKDEGDASNEYFSFQLSGGIEVGVLKRGTEVLQNISNKVAVGLPIENK